MKKTFIAFAMLLSVVFLGYSKIWEEETEVDAGVYEVKLHYDLPETEEQREMLSKIIKLFHNGDPYYMVLICKYNKLYDVKNKQTKESVVRSNAPD